MQTFQHGPLGCSGLKPIAGARQKCQGLALIAALKSTRGPQGNDLQVKVRHTTSTMTPASMVRASHMFASKNATFTRARSFGFTMRCS